MQKKRYLATLTEYNHQLVSGLVVEVSAGVITDVFRLADCRCETAQTLCLDGILRGNIRVGAPAELYLEDLRNSANTTAVATATLSDSEVGSPVG